MHLLRNSFRYASKKDWPGIARDLKPVYHAPTEAAALDRLAEFSDTWEDRYPAIVRMWEHAWSEFVPFLNFDPEIRTVICTTNAIEASTRGSAELSRRGDTSRTSRLHSNAYTWWSAVLTRPAGVVSVGLTGGKGP